MSITKYAFVFCWLLGCQSGGSLALSPTCAVTADCSLGEACVAQRCLRVDCFDNSDCKTGSVCSPSFGCVESGSNRDAFGIDAVVGNGPNGVLHDGLRVKGAALDGVFAAQLIAGDAEVWGALRGQVWEVTVSLVGDELELLLPDAVAQTVAAAGAPADLQVRVSHITRGSDSETVNLLRGETGPQGPAGVLPNAITGNGTDGRLAKFENGQVVDAQLSENGAMMTSFLPLSAPSIVAGQITLSQDAITATDTLRINDALTVQHAGNTIVSGNLAYATPRFHWKRVPAREFHGWTGSLFDDVTLRVAYNQSLNVNVELPQGAVIRQMQCTYTDSDGEYPLSATAVFGVASWTSSNAWSVVPTYPLLTSTFATPDNGVFTANVNAASVIVVDNEQNDYFITLTFAYNSQSYNKMGFRGCRVGYDMVLID